MNLYSKKTRRTFTLVIVIVLVLALVAGVVASLV
jgi:hypothetical protein